MQLIQSCAAIVAVAVSLALPVAARAQETPPAGADAKPEKHLGVVKLEIDERLDGKAHRDAAATVKIRKKLRELGFVVWTDKPLYVDEYEKRKKEKEAQKGGAAAPSGTAAPDEKPAADLVIKGTIAIKLDRTSTFFGGNVAFMYASAVDLVVADRSGKALATVGEKDEWGKTEEKKAREDEIRRTAAFAAVAVLKSEPVYGRLGPKSKAAVDDYVAEVVKSHPRSPPENETPADGAKDGPAPGGKSGEQGGEKKQ